MCLSSGIAFKPEEATDALKEFIGQIIATDYALEPFGMKGAPGIDRKSKVLAIQIKTEVYDKPQYEWYPPSRVKKTKPIRSRETETLKAPTGQSRLIGVGVKWLYFVEALNQIGAMKDLAFGGANDEERMTNFAKSLQGCVFRFEEQECESLVKERGGALKRFSVLLPVEYFGKKPIEKEAEIKQTTIGEAVSAAPAEELR